MMVTGATPALVALQQSMKQPFFDGDEKKWPQFVRDWQRYVAYMLLGAPEGAVGDVWKRDLLITCLHHVLGRRYQTMVLAKPGMQFGDVWKDLERHFAIDDPHHWRAMWDRVELQHQGEIIRLKEWLFFQAEFEAAKAQVSDWTEQGELDLLLKKLPAGWRTRVLKAEAKEARRKFAVKVTGCPIGGEKLRAVMSQLGVRVKSVKDLANCSVLSLGDESDHLRVMDMKELTIGGQKPSLQTVRERWSATKIFDFIAEELRVEQESWVLGGKQSSKSIFTDAAPRERQTAAVEEQPKMSQAAVVQQRDGARQSEPQRGKSPHRTSSGADVSKQAVPAAGKTQCQ